MSIIETVLPIPKEAFEAIGQKMLQPVMELALPILAEAAKNLRDLSPNLIWGAGAFLLSSAHGLVNASVMIVALAGIIGGDVSHDQELTNAAFSALLGSGLTGLLRVLGAATEPRNDFRHE